MKKIYFLQHSRGTKDGEIYVFDLVNKRTEDKEVLEKKIIEHLYILEPYDDSSEDINITNDCKLKTYEFNNIVLFSDLYDELKLEWKKEDDNLYTSINICMSEDKSILETYNDELKMDYQQYVEENYYRGRR